MLASMAKCICAQGSGTARPYLYYSLNSVRMLIFLKSGLFSCLGFRVLFCFFVAVWAGAPPKQQKKKYAPAQTAKNKTPPPLPSVFFFFFFFPAWAGGCFCCFCCLGRGRVFFLLFGRGACFFSCCLGGGREFTHLPVCLARL